MFAEGHGPGARTGQRAPRRPPSQGLLPQRGPAETIEQRRRAAPADEQHVVAGQRRGDGLLALQDVEDDRVRPKTLVVRSGHSPLLRRRVRVGAQQDRHARSGRFEQGPVERDSTRRELNSRILPLSIMDVVVGREAS